MKYYLPFFFFCSFSYCSCQIKDYLLPYSHDEIIKKHIAQTSNNLKNYKSAINTILIVSIIITAFTSYLTYNSLNKPSILLNLKSKNPNSSIEDIHSSLQIGFITNILITTILSYILFKYNKSQQNIQNDLQNISNITPY